MKCAVSLPVLSLLLSYLFVSARTAVDSRTFFGNNSYTRYPAWNANPQRILRFTFRTSALNSLLVFTEAPGEDTGNFLLVRLVNGTALIRLGTRPGEFEDQRLGAFLNDNEPHTLTILDDTGFSRLRYRLDSDSIVDQMYPTNVPAFGPNGVFFGGVPQSSPLANNTFFTGCLEDVLFLSGVITSIDMDSSTLERPDPSEVGVAVQDGCMDPCEGRSCGRGVCVTRWPNQSFCDCSNAFRPLGDGANSGVRMLGEDCEEDGSDYQVTFEPNSNSTHYCYRPQMEPYTSQSNSASVELLPPLPSEGTILVSHPDSGESSFSLRLENSRVVFQYEMADGMKRDLVLSTELNRTGSTYRIDLLTTPQSTEVLIYTISDDVGVVLLESQVTGDARYEETTLYTVTCLGGSLLEYDNYVGTIRNAFYGYNSLLEQRNFCPLEIQGVSRSDLISFVDDGVGRSLEFERLSFHSHRIYLEARYPEEEPRGILMFVDDGEVQFIITAVGDRDLLMIVQPGTLAITCLGRGFTPFDGNWHSYEIFPNLDPPQGEMPSVELRFDGVSCSLQHENLRNLSNSHLQFGSTHDSIVVDGTEPAIFAGCIANFEFQPTENSEIFRPNLEAAPRTNLQVDLAPCYHCLSPGLSCGEGEVCVDRGSQLGRELTCECPQGLTGDMCLDPLPEQLNIDALAPNFFCTAPTFNTTPPATETTPPHTPTTTTTTTTTTTDGDQTTPTTMIPAGTSGPLLSTGAWIGVGVGIAIILLVLLAAAIILCIFYRTRAGIRGFYQTNESTGPEASMLRYSASLRQLSSEVVSLSKEPSEVSWSQKNGKDYSNGGPPSFSKPMNGLVAGSTSGSNSSRDKEFYL